MRKYKIRHMKDGKYIWFRHHLNDKDVTVADVIKAVRKEFPKIPLENLVILDWDKCDVGNILAIIEKSKRLWLAEY